MTRLELTVRELVGEILTLSNQTRPPIKLSPLFPHRRVMQVFPANLSGKRAKLVQVQDGFVLQYKNMGKSVNRFSIAHELGHTYYYDITTSPPSRLGVPPIGVVDEERFCDQFAAELLMPAQFVSEAITDICGASPRYPHTKSLVKLAERFKVSVRVAARRLIRDLAVWDAIAICCLWTNKPQANNAHRTNAWAWRGVWGYKPEKYGKSLYLPSFRNSPKVRISAVAKAYESSLKDENSGVSTYSEPVSSLRLGNLASFLKRQGYDKECTLSISRIGLDRESFVDEFASTDDYPVDLRRRCRILVVIPLQP